MGEGGALGEKRKKLSNKRDGKRDASDDENLFTMGEASANLREQGKQGEEVNVYTATKEEQKLMGGSNYPIREKRKKPLNKRDGEGNVKRCEECRSHHHREEQCRDKSREDNKRGVNGCRIRCGLCGSQKNLL